MHPIVCSQNIRLPPPPPHTSFKMPCLSGRYTRGVFSKHPSVIHPAPNHRLSVNLPHLVWQLHSRSELETRLGLRSLRSTRYTCTKQFEREARKHTRGCEPATNNGTTDIDINTNENVLGWEERGRCWIEKHDRGWRLVEGSLTRQLSMLSFGSLGWEWRVNTGQG